MSQCHDAYSAEGYQPSRGRPAQGTQCHDESLADDGGCAELTLANSVREWAEQVAPGDESTIRAGVGTAVYYFASGASVSEACEEARSRVLCRLRHPSHVPSQRPMAAAS